MHRCAALVALVAAASVFACKSQKTKDCERARDLAVRHGEKMLKQALEELSAMQENGKPADPKIQREVAEEGKKENDRTRERFVAACVAQEGDVDLSCFDDERWMHGPCERKWDPILYSISGP